MQPVTLEQRQFFFTGHEAVGAAVGVTAYELESSGLLGLRLPRFFAAFVDGKLFVQTGGAIGSKAVGEVINELETLERSEHDHQRNPG